LLGFKLAKKLLLEQAFNSKKTAKPS